MQTLSRAKLKLFASLAVKKYRRRHRMFAVEGIKMYEEALKAGWKAEAILLREDLAGTWTPLAADTEVWAVPEKDFEELTQLQHPEGIICILHIPEGRMEEGIVPDILPPGPGFLLHEIQDPGNLGTIVRSADWFGMEWIMCSPGCTDLLNAKTLRSSMGSVFRVNVSYPDNWDIILQQNLDRIRAADMEGESLATLVMAPDDVPLIGNEARGLPDALRTLEGLRRVTIPRLGGAESLNAAVAASILAWKLRFGI